MEISSFQLDDSHVFRPDIAVLLNITPDHLNRYNYDLRITWLQDSGSRENKTEDVFIVNRTTQ